MNAQIVNYSRENSKKKLQDNKTSISSSISSSISKTSRGLSAQTKKISPVSPVMDLSKLISQTNKKTETFSGTAYNPFYQNALTRSLDKNTVRSLSPSKRLDYDNLIPPQTAPKLGKKTLVLDLDETLIHSAFQPFSCGVDITLKVIFILKENR
jgi:TFIIF-interacting CTD phosphatase-like protein